MRSKILMIDDDTDHLKVCQMIFEKAGYEVVTVPDCSTAEKALDEIKNAMPDLIYTDHEIPGTHGGQIIRRLKETEFAANIPILYFSGHSQIDELAARYGADGYICKPFDTAQLLALTRKHLDGRINNLSD